MNAPAAPARGERRRHLLVALLSATLLAASFPPLGLFPLAFVALAPWIAFHRARPRRGTLLALGLATYAYHCARMFWVAEISLPPVFIIPLFGVPTTLLLAFLLDRAVHRLRLSPYLVYPTLWAGIDWLLETLIGTSWAAPGYAVAPWLEGVQLASVFRVHGLSVVVLLVNVLVADLLLSLWRKEGLRSRMRPAALVGTVLVATHLFGMLRLADEGEPGPLAVGIQPNIAQGDKNRRLTWEEMWWKHHQVLRRHREGEEPIDLLVGPETSFRPLRVTAGAPTLSEVLDWYFPRAWTGGIPQRWGDILPVEGGMTVLGVLRTRPVRPGEPDDYGDGETEENLAMLVQGEREVGAYAKRVLVPLGETVPGRGWLPWRDALLAMIRDDFRLKPDMRAGEEQPVYDLKTPRGAWRFALSICYEIVFATDYREPFAGPDLPQFLVNISNDGWYGESSELDQVHLMSRFRAVETGRSLFRVSNTGISTLIDGRGRYLATVAAADGDRKAVEGVLEGRIPVFSGRTGWIRGGEWLAALPGIVGLLALLFGLVRRTPGREIMDSGPKPPQVG